MKRKSIKIIIVGILVCFGLLAILIYNGIIQINGLAILKYEVRGVDVEPYGIYSGSSMIDQAVIDELSVWLQIVEASYEMSPVIYTTEEYYDQLHEILPQYDIWIRSVYSEPRSGISWSIWQYSNRMRLNGYSGSEKYIDMNVYNGTLEDFENYGK